MGYLAEKHNVLTDSNVSHDLASDGGKASRNHGAVVNELVADVLKTIRVGQLRIREVLADLKLILTKYSDSKATNLANRGNHLRLPFNTNRNSGRLYANAI
jgi:hypothetical protein